MPTYNTEMQPIIDDLDEKIAALQRTKAAVQAALDKSIAVPRNTSAMEKINQSLGVAQKARVSLFDDCCGASCPIVWEE